MKRFGSGILLLLAGVALSACAGPSQWGRQEAKTREDFQTFRDQERARAAYEACAERALPGSVENLECQMAFARKPEQPPKPSPKQ